MLNSKKLASAALAGLLAVGVMGTGVALAADSGTNQEMEKNACKGPNGCKGESADGKHACKGQNACKGQGADGKNACKGMGSCATDGSKMH